MENRHYLFQLRAFRTDPDYEMVCRWCESRKRQPHWGRAVAPPLEILPPIGNILYRTDGFEREDLAAMWLYLAADSPLCFAEHCVTKPGLRLETAKLAIMELGKFFRALAHSLGYSIMIAHVLPAMARYMQKEEWHRADGELIAMWQTTSHQLLEVTA